MLQIKTYEPAVSSTSNVGVSPTGISSTSSTTSIPAPASSTAPFSSVGSAVGSGSVRITTNSWVSSGPLFSMLKVTDPAETLLGSAPTANSCNVTETSSPPPPHPAATSASETAAENNITPCRYRVIEPSSGGRLLHLRCVLAVPREAVHPRAVLQCLLSVLQ